MVVLLALVAVVLFLGMFVESLAILVILIPVIVTISKMFGFDPMYMGMVIIMATQIGATTPPVAVGLFVATSMLKQLMTRHLNTAAICLCSFFVLLLVIFIPWLSTVIPNHFLGAQ